MGPVLTIRRTLIKNFRMSRSCLTNFGVCYIIVCQSRTFAKKLY